MSTLKKNPGIASTTRLAALPRLRDELPADTQIVQYLKEAGETYPAAEESLIVDDRSAVSPAQMVENKLSRILKDASIPVSHLQMRGLLRAR